MRKRRFGVVDKFTGYTVDREGRVVARFSTQTADDRPGRTGNVFVLDKASLEEKAKHLKKKGLPCEEELRALRNWPEEKRWE